MLTSPVGKYFVIRSKLNPKLVLGLQDDTPNAKVVTSELTADREPGEDVLWYLDNGTGTIRNKRNNMCIDVKESRLLVRKYDSGCDSQRWVVCEDRIQTYDDFELVVSIDDKVNSVAYVASYTGSDGQHWQLECRSPEYFYVTCHDGTKVLDVRHADLKPGARVIVYANKSDMSDNQLWYEDQDGILRSKLNDFAIDTSGKDVVLQPYKSENPCQQWIVTGSTIVNRQRGNQVLEMKSGGLLLDATVFATERLAGNACQTWSFQHVACPQADLPHHSGDGKLFAILSLVNGLALEVQDRTGLVGTPVVTAVFASISTNNLQQLFYSDDVTGTIKSALNNFCLDIAERRLVITPYDPYNRTQQWRIDGSKIHTPIQPELALTLTSSSKEPGITVSPRPYKGDDLQQWHIKHLPAKCFHIVSQMNSKVLDIKEEDVHSGAKVIMYDRKVTVSANQLWYEDENAIIRSKLNGFVLEAAEGDHVKMRPYNASNRRQHWMIVGDRIQNKYDNRLVLDIDGESHRNGASLSISNFTGGDNQRWMFESVAGTTGFS